MKIVTKADIVAGLQEIGLKEGDTVIVHTSLSNVIKIGSFASIIA